MNTEQRTTGFGEACGGMAISFVVLTFFSCSCGHLSGTALPFTLLALLITWRFGLRFLVSDSGLEAVFSLALKLIALLAVGPTTLIFFKNVSDALSS